jgi:hypothetical protein
MRGILAALALFPLLAACQREAPPAQEIAKSAEKLVGTRKAEPPQLAEGPYAPRDTCGDLKDADTFRQTLAAAIEARDADAVAALAAEDVKLDFGGGSGREELRTRLRAEDSRLWEELEELMALGCSANKHGGMTIPWYFDQTIRGVDPLAGMIVTDEKVPVLATPEEDAEIVTTLSWDVVTISALNPENPYQRVETRDGQKGYIATDKLRSLIDYRLLAVSRNNNWRIVSLVAGD